MDTKIGGNTYYDFISYKITQGPVQQFWLHMNVGLNAFLCMILDLLTVCS